MTRNLFHISDFLSLVSHKFPPISFESWKNSNNCSCKLLIRMFRAIYLVLQP